MSTLFSLFPISRIAALRRAPFWAQALAICALFAVVGVAIVDDYWAAFSAETLMRGVAIANADYIATGDISELSQNSHILSYRHSGMAFEMPLLLAERALGLQDSRHIYLTRHLLAHLLFIAGGFACGMLAYRMVGSRWVALLAMLLFLLHPRLYAHSFFNIRDIPFAALFVIALYLTHRAFRRDTLGAFLLCGIGAGLAMELRVFGLLLPPMILAMRALDMWRAGREERKRILMTGAAFLAAALATVYIVHPYYWENPLQFIDAILFLSQRSGGTNNLFMGAIYRPDAVPWNYVPVWFAITSPPVALLLGALGSAVVCRQAISRALATLTDREIRFRMTLLGCIVLPVAVVIILQGSFYQGWRLMYFLWGPFCLLASIGLRAIANISMGGGIWKIGARLPVWARGGLARRALAYGIVGIGLATTLTAMAAMHPYEYLYFNALTDTKTPGALGERYDMDYWVLAQLQSLEYLLSRYPGDTLRVWPKRKNEVRLILPQEDRDRVMFTLPHAADFYLLHHKQEFTIRNIGESASLHLHPRVNLLNIPNQPPIHSVRLYGNLITSIVPKDLDAYRAAYADVVANGDPLAYSEFDIYFYDGALYYLSADCAPPMSNADVLWVFLHIIPDDLADLPANRRELGFENRDFRLARHAAFFDGKCIYRQPLPDYPIARIRTGQDVAGETVWRADIDLAAHAAAQALYDSIAAGNYGRPVAQSVFDVYLRGAGLAYLKENCEAGDIDARFFLHIFPTDPADLPADGRELGFANLDFQFADHGAYAGDKCVAERELPNYAIERIRTGQFVSGEGRVWDAEFLVGR